MTIKLKLIEHLKRKAEEHVQLALLLSQWNIDEILIPRALQNIGYLFPHYSRHDVSHSLQILVNIESLLGKDIDKLSATDTWLILEAAYWHDIGMVVPADKILHDFETQEFKCFLAEIIDNNGHELQIFAKQFNSHSASLCFSNIESPLEAVEKFRLLLAEYYRRQHPERAESIITDPWEQGGISSPRNELIHKRLFLMLGLICLSHGKDFSFILKNLPFKQVGMGGENCHPRFVACLLRLGDLLDLDNGRFCPVMLRMIHKLPKLSQAHIDKHQAIRELRLDRERIDITASCNSAAAYEETERWFNWLRQEMQNQMASWQRIVPERAFGLLPTLGKLHVSLEGEEQWLDSSAKERPRFDIDAEKAIELLQGSGLYEKPEQSLRELLQNAVDATLQRVWLEFSPDAGNAPLHESLKPDNWNNPYDKKMVSLLEQYAIKITFASMSEQNENGKICWYLTIQDHGVGISKEDLKRLRRVGGSSRDYDKKERVKKMPNWMRPSGAFGIGLQSAFMITESISFKTKSYLTGDAQEIIMHSPHFHQGLITIKKYNPLPGGSYGSILTLIHKFEKIPTSNFLILGDNFHARQALYNYDPIIDQELEVEPRKWLDEIEKFAKNSPVPIQCFFKDKLCKFKNKVEEKKYDFNDKDNVALQVSPSMHTDVYVPRIYFRGQSVSQFNKFSIPFLALTCHLWGYDAGVLLTINRNNIKDQSTEELYENLMKTLYKYIKRTTYTEEESYYLSAFIHWQDEEENYPNLKAQWKNLLLYPRSQVMQTFKDLYALEEFRIILRYSNDKKNITLEPESTIFYCDSSYDVRFNLFAHEWQKSGFYIQIMDKRSDCTEFLFKREPLNPYSNQALKILLHELAKNPPFSRACMPIYSNYEEIASKKDTALYYVQGLYGSKYFRRPMMVIPFKFSSNRSSSDNELVIEDKIEDLCAWTVKNAKYSSLTAEKAEKLYKNIINWIDNDIMKDDELWKKLRIGSFTSNDDVNSLILTETVAL